MIDLPKKGQWWLNTTDERLRITEVVRGMVFFVIPATDSWGGMALSQFLNRCRRRPVKTRTK